MLWLTRCLRRTKIGFLSITKTQSVECRTQNGNKLRRCRLIPARLFGLASVRDSVCGEGERRLRQIASRFVRTPAGHPQAELRSATEPPHPPREVSEKRKVADFGLLLFINMDNTLYFQIFYKAYGFFSCIQRLSVIVPFEKVKEFSDIIRLTNLKCDVKCLFCFVNVSMM